MIDSLIYASTTHSGGYVHIAVVFAVLVVENSNLVRSSCMHKSVIFAGMLRNRKGPRCMSQSPRLGSKARWK